MQEMAGKSVMSAGRTCQGCVLSVFRLKRGKEKGGRGIEGWREEGRKEKGSERIYTGVDCEKYFYKIGL